MAGEDSHSWPWFFGLGVDSATLYTPPDAPEDEVAELVRILRGEAGGDEASNG